MSPEIIAAIASAIVAVLGGLATFYNRSKILDYFKNKNKLRSDRNKQKLEAETIDKLDLTYKEALETGKLDKDAILEAMKITQENIDKQTDKIEKS